MTYSSYIIYNIYQYIYRSYISNLLMAVARAQRGGAMLQLLLLLRLLAAQELPSSTGFLGALQGPAMSYLDSYRSYRSYI